ncbi:MAG: hypothetical protein RLZZ499_2747, partial [Cyanobacteriota bacterium]
MGVLSSTLTRAIEVVPGDIFKLGPA